MKSGRARERVRVSQSDQQPVKRRRGRPRKQSVGAAVEHDAISVLGTEGRQEQALCLGDQASQAHRQADPPPPPKAPQRDPTVDNMHYWLQERILISKSFEYFLDKYVFIEDKATNSVIKLDLWPEQRNFLPTLLIAKIIEVIKAHQLGFTWIIVAAYALWRSITTTLFHTVINSFNEDVGLEIIKRVEFIRQRLPEMLYPPLSKSVTDQLEFDHRDENGLQVPSLIQVIPATERGGQGKTPNLMIFDESCQNRYFERAYNASYPGIEQAGGQIIIISNAIKNVPGWPFTRALYSGSMAGTNRVSRIFLPWWAHPGRSRAIVKGEDGTPMLDGKGKPMTEFKYHTLRAGGKDGGQMTEEDFSQRYPETEAEAISVLGGSYFGVALTRHSDPTLTGQVGSLIASEKQGEVPRFQVDGPGQQASLLTVWRPPYWLHADYLPGRYWTDRYCVGADVSEGLGQSYSVAYVLDRVTEEFVARLRGNRIPAHNLAPVLYWLAQWYRNALYISHDTGIVTWDNAPIAVERTGAGQTTVGILEEMGATQYQKQIVGKLGDHITSQLGWHESQQAKYDLSEALRNWLATTKGTIHCSVLLDEAGTWTQYDGTKRLGPEGGHLGDCVMAAGVTIQCGLSMGGSPKLITVTSNATATDRRLIRLARMPERDEEEGFYDVMEEQETEEDSYTVDYVSLGKMSLRR